MRAGNGPAEEEHALELRAVKLAQILASAGRDRGDALHDRGGTYDIFLAVIADVDVRAVRRKPHGARARRRRPSTKSFTPRAMASAVPSWKRALRRRASSAGLEMYPVSTR